MNKPVGFIGLGNMGLPMVKLLLKNGYSVLGSDINEEACRSFTEHGGQLSTVHDMVESAYVIILMLPNSHIVNDVIGQIKSSLLSLNRRNTNEIAIIDMSSSFPTDTQHNAYLLNEIGVQLLDAPVSGGVKKAVTGELTIMVGGDKETFAEHFDLLKVLGTSIFHVGPIGSGHLVKSLNNYLSAVHMLATCEAVKVLSDFGIDPRIGVDIFSRSSGRSGSTDYKFPEFVLTEKYNSGFSLELMLKDIETARLFMEQTGESTPLAKLTADTYKAAKEALDPKADHTEIFRYVSSYIQ